MPRTRPARPARTPEQLQTYHEMQWDSLCQQLKLTEDESEALKSTASSCLDALVKAPHISAEVIDSALLRYSFSRALTLDALVLACRERREEPEVAQFLGRVSSLLQETLDSRTS